MDLSPSLRVHLDALAPYLEDKTVTEVLVAGPDQVLVTRGGGARAVELELPETRIRALSERLARALGASKVERGELISGRVGELYVTLVGAPRGPRCPVVRVARRGSLLDSLEVLEGRGELDPSTRAALEDAVRARRSLLVAGPRSARCADFLGALARAWQLEGRVALLSDGGEALAPDWAHLHLDAEAVGAAVALGADVLVVPDPTPAVWSQLLTLGRPFVACVEAIDAEAALARTLGLSMAGQSTWSRAAAEALLLASIALILELAGEGEGPARGLHRPVLADGQLGLRRQNPGSRPPEARPRSTPPVRPPPAETRPAAPPPRPTPGSVARARPEPTGAPRRPSSRPILARPSSRPADRNSTPVVESQLSQALSSTAATPDQADLSDILPHNLLSTSFVGLIERSADSAPPSDADETGLGGPLDSAGRTLPLAPTPDLESPTPDLLGDGEADFADEATDGTKELLRGPVERLPTLALPPPGQRARVGLGSDAWAAREYKRQAEPPPDPLDVAELNTSTGQMPPDLDPFEVDAGESTFHADGHEMVPTGSYAPDIIEADPDDVRDSRIDPPGVISGLEEDWDAEAPSEIIATPSDRPEPRVRRGR